MSDYAEAFKIETEDDRVVRLKKAMGETAAAMLTDEIERFLRWLAWDKQATDAAEDLFLRIEYCGGHPGATLHDYYTI